MHCFWAVVKNTCFRIVIHCPRNGRNSVMQPNKMREFGGSRLRFVFDCLSFISSPQTLTNTVDQTIICRGGGQNRTGKSAKTMQNKEVIISSTSSSQIRIVPWIAKKVVRMRGEPPRWSLDSLRFLPLPILSPSSFAHYIFLPAVCWLLLLRLSSGAACSEAKDFPSFFAEFEFTFFSCFYLPIALLMSIWFSWYSLSPVFSCWWILKFIVFGIFYLFVGTGSATIFVLLCFTVFSLFAYFLSLLYLSLHFLRCISLNWRSRISICVFAVFFFLFWNCQS